MRSPVKWILLSLPLLLPVAASAQDVPKALEEAAANPTATGILVTSVIEGTPAAEVGLAPGDIVVGYAGEPAPDLPTLAALKQKAMDQDLVEFVFVRRGEKHAVTIPTGPIGFMGTAVEKGRPTPPFPPDTGVKFDFSSLDAHPIDAWYAFRFGDDPPVGFEHVTVKRDGGRIYQVSEVSFDGGEQYGDEHNVVTVVMTDEPTPRFVMCRFESITTGWTGTAFVADPGAKEPQISFTTKMGEETDRVSPVAVPARAVPTYFIETLARFLPREEGACFRFRPLMEGSATVSLPSAVVCRGRETIERNGEPAKVWRYEWVDLIGVVGSNFWIDDAGRVLRVDWGGANGELVTKEEALAGLPDRLKPVR